MTNKELNQLLVTSFPELKHAYDEEVSWQEGDDTGSHVVFGDVFTPHIEKLIVAKNEDKLKNIFNFIEEILAINSKYCDEVIAFSVLEKLFDNFEYIKYSRGLMGKKTLQICEELKDSLGL